MKCLIIFPDEPPSGSNEMGGYKRMRMFVNALAGFTSQIDMLFLVHEGYVEKACDLAALSAQQSSYWGCNVRALLAPTDYRQDSNWNRFRSLFSIRHHQHFYAFAGARQNEAVRAAVAAKPDFILVHLLSAMLPLMRSKSDLPPVFFDLDDVEHKSRLRRLIEPPISAAKLLSTTQIGALHLAERKAIRMARSTFVCSEADKRYLAKLSLRNVEVVPNAVAMPGTCPALAAGPTIGFIGNFWHPPNVSAAERLVRQIWPLVRMRVPEAELLIAGKPVEALNSSAHPPDGVRYLGYVPDIDEFYQAARVICSPIMAGGGTRVKLVEAASYGKPIVSTKIGAEGLGLRNGDEICLDDLDEDIAAACVRLLLDDEACLRMGNAARRRVEATYDIHRIEDGIARLVEKAIVIKQLSDL